MDHPGDAQNVPFELQSALLGLTFISDDSTSQNLLTIGMFSADAESRVFYVVRKNVRVSRPGWGILSTATTIVPTQSSGF